MEKWGTKNNGRLEVQLKVAWVVGWSCFVVPKIHKLANMYPLLLLIIMIHHYVHQPSIQCASVPSSQALSRSSKFYSWVYTLFSVLLTVTASSPKANTMSSGSKARFQKQFGEDQFNGFCFSTSQQRKACRSFMGSWRTGHLLFLDPTWTQLPVCEVIATLYFSL